MSVAQHQIDAKEISIYDILLRSSVSEHTALPQRGRIIIMLSGRITNEIHHMLISRKKKGKPKRMFRVQYRVDVNLVISPP
jgi:hypothetical protein